MKYLLIAIFLCGACIDALVIKECWKDYYRRSVNSIHDAGNRNCTDGGVYVAGLCYGKCPTGDVQQVTGWCKKPSGVLYISRTYQPKCSSSLEEQAGLCYGWCKDGFKGIGLLCWSKCEGRTDYPADCGMYCGENGPYCDVRNINIILTLGASIGSVVTNPTLSSGIEQINSITNQVSGHEVCKVQV